jgi:Xaa-Pro dipeptidase
MEDIFGKINFEQRQARLENLLASAGLDALILNAGPTLTYLTGLNFHLSERPIIGMFVPGRVPILFLPELEANKLEALPFHLHARTYGEDPATWRGVIQPIFAEMKINRGRAGVEPNRFRFLEYQLLHEACPEMQFSSAERIVAGLRMYKEPQEVEAMRTAVRIAQNALRTILPSIRRGESERQLAARISAQALLGGADAELPFSPIVASGPNSANPHAVAGERTLQAGDWLIIDWGAAFQGYIADLTRTFAVGEADEELAHVASVVLEANAAARNLARPGVTAGEIDLAARKIIAEAGYGQYFIHRTGHGLGMEPHEEPYLFAGNDLRLEAGMTFTIEPGIYLPGRGGVRIEDDILITPAGCESLSDLPRELSSIVLS